MSIKGVDFRRVAESSWFNGGAIGVVLVNAVLIGVQTYMPGSRWLEWTLEAIVWVFIVEVLIRFLGRVSTRSFFRDGWNIFDIVLIVAAFLPETGGLAPVVRVLRVLRIFRLVRTIPELRMIVTVLWKSVISMKWIGLLAVICFYVFAVAGTKLFGKIQPEEFGTLHESVFTLFRILTQDNWSDLRYQAVAEKGWLWATGFHLMWIVIATFVLINLVVGAIINNYQQVQEVEQHRKVAADATDERIEALVAELSRLMEARRAARAAGDPISARVDPHAAPPGGGGGGVEGG